LSHTSTGHGARSWPTDRLPRQERTREKSREPVSAELTVSLSREDCPTLRTTSRLASGEHPCAVSPNGVVHGVRGDGRFHPASGQSVGCFHDYPASMGSGRQADCRTYADMSFFELRRQLEYQDGTAWWLGGYSGPLVSVQRDVFGLWDGPGKNAAGYPPVDLSGLWNPPRPGRTCGQEPPGVWLGRPKRIYGEFRRTPRLLREKRWSSSQDDGETGLSEAGSKQRI